MNVYGYKLSEYIKKSNVICEHLIFNKSCHSVKEASETAGADIDDFVKNICLVDTGGKLIVAIVKGQDRVSTKKLAKVLNIERPKTANPETIIEKTGYPIGGVPSFGYEAIFLIDERVMEKEAVYSGGGSPNALVKIGSKKLLEANKGIVARIRK